MSHFNASVGPKSHLHIKSRRWDSFEMPIKWSRLCKSMTNSQRKETPNNKFSFGAACSRRLFGCQRRPKKKKKIIQIDSYAWNVVRIQQQGSPWWEAPPTTRAVSGGKFVCPDMQNITAAILLLLLSLRSRPSRDHSFIRCIQL